MSARAATDDGGGAGRWRADHRGIAPRAAVRKNVRFESRMLHSLHFVFMDGNEMIMRRSFFIKGDLVDSPVPLHKKLLPLRPGDRILITED